MAAIESAPSDLALCLSFGKDMSQAFEQFSRACDRATQQLAAMHETFWLWIAADLGVGTSVLDQLTGSSLLLLDDYALIHALLGAARDADRYGRERFLVLAVESGRLTFVEAERLWRRLWPRCARP